jgi:hypothetical protein
MNALYLTNFSFQSNCESVIFCVEVALVCSFVFSDCSG